VSVCSLKQANFGLNTLVRKGSQLQLYAHIRAEEMSANCLSQIS
jgi:hypothetical protein